MPTLLQQSGTLLCVCLQLRHLQEAGLLQQQDVQFAADLWGQPGYGLGELYSRRCCCCCCCKKLQST
jgi:hypothetical protein